MLFADVTDDQEALRALCSACFLTIGERGLS